MTRACSVAALVVASGWALGQPAAESPRIDVATVKPSDPGITAMNNHFSPGRFTLIGYSLQYLIQSAYSVRSYQVLNAPGWLRSERWNLEGTITAPIRLISNFQLIQPLLAERYQLRVHRETRMLPVYSLVVAKGGPKLKTARDDEQTSMRYGNQIIGRKFDIKMLAPSLSGELNLPVIDNTGLTGFYDIDLMWTPDPARMDFGDVKGPTELPAPDPNRPEIFTAIKEQLGLELKAEKGPVDVIVIEHAERPTPNY